MKRTPIIKVKDLYCGYGDNLILYKVNFEVYEGEIFAILGESGCGKSTLMRHMIGLIPPLKGEVYIDGDKVDSTDYNTYKRIIKKIGVSYQDGALLSSLTLAENVALPIKEHTAFSNTAINALAHMKLAMVRLDGFEEYFPSEISGGMRKRAALARAMALSPKILFFDEPSAGLDPISAAELDSLIAHLNKSHNTTIVIVTHELRTVFRVVHRVILLDKGSKQVVGEGEPKYLRDHSPNDQVRRFLSGGIDDKGKEAEDHVWLPGA